MFTFGVDCIILLIVKVTKTIFAYLLVMTFLVPATGFYYTKHSCLKSGQVQLVLAGDYSCCAEISHTAQKALATESSCCNHDIIEQESSCCDNELSNQAGMDENCSVENPPSNCCINTGNYLKSQDEYTSPGKVELPHVNMLITAALFSIELLPAIDQTIEENAHSPPFTIASVDILHKHSVLII